MKVEKVNKPKEFEPFNIKIEEYVDKIILLEMLNTYYNSYISDPYIQQKVVQLITEIKSL